MTAALLLSLLLIGAEPPPVDFDTEIIPVLTKAGCNAGACHGAAAGRGGFRLSLFGRDAGGDYDQIVHALEGRRINLARPAESLLLKKPTGYLDHGGDVALPEESIGAATVLAWIKAGAPHGTGRKLVELKVFADRPFVETVPSTVRLSALARFDDSAAVHVTQQTVFTPADPAAIEILETADGKVIATINRRGPQVIIARFLDQVIPLTIISPFGEQQLDLHNEAPVNFIDEEVNRTLSLLRLPPSPPADDATYIRRVTLDLIGCLPKPEEVEAYLQDTAADKRERLVDKLLNYRIEFLSYWTLRYARQLRIHSLPNEKQALIWYSGWLEGAIAERRTYQSWARALLTATGDTHANGPANFGRMVNDARGQAELVGELFLGARLGCANCHDHPLDRWTQDDYHGLAAVFARLDRGRIVQRTARGEVTNPRTGEPAIPRIPGVKDLDPAVDNIDAAAEWLTSEANPWFARAAVNRLWQGMFGRGLVEPVDDLRSSNPATHPELLDLLARDFIAHGYELRHTLRTIALSRTYARSHQPLAANAADDRYYSHSYRRPLMPEVLADAIGDTTGVGDPLLGSLTMGRAVRLVDPLQPHPALDILGRCSRATGCADRAGGGLATQLHLLNGELINHKVTTDGRLQKMLKAGATNEQIVREFYLRGLSREPAKAELDRWLELLHSDDEKERKARCEDFVWSLLCSRDFVENH